MWRLKKVKMIKWLSKYPKTIWCLRNLVPMILFPIADFYLFEWYTNCLLYTSDAADEL